MNAASIVVGSIASVCVGLGLAGLVIYVHRQINNK